MENFVKAELPLPYRWLKSYIRLLVEKAYYREVHYIGQENIPADGTPLLIVSDHQNSLNDALGLLLSVNDRLVHFIVRADVFALSPLADKFLRSIGLLPAFRMNFEGESALSNNGATFRDSEKALSEGESVVIYPEAGHQDKHWLGTFSYGYTKMAFDAAEMTGFSREIFILPSCNHYSDYFGLRNDMLVKYGTPVSLKPYYELYRTKPRTAQREVNAIVRDQIKSMMLNIEDLPNYEAIDFLRRGTYGETFAESCGYDPESLPDRLESDRKLVADLAAAKESDEAAVQTLYDEASSLEKDLKSAGLTESVLDNAPTAGSLAFQAAVMIVLLPLAAFALWPSLICWFVPKYFSRKVGDRMLSGSFVIGLNVLFILPLAGLLTFILTWINASFIAALIYTAALVPLCLFEWTYAGWIGELVTGIKARKAVANGRFGDLLDRRKKLFFSLDTILLKNKSNI